MPRERQHFNFSKWGHFSSSVLSFVSMKPLDILKVTQATTDCFPHPIQVVFVPQPNEYRTVIVSHYDRNNFYLRIRVSPRDFVRPFCTVRTIYVTVETHRSDHLKTSLRSPFTYWIRGKKETEGRTDMQTHWETDGWITDRTANRERMTSWLIWVTSQLMQRRRHINKAAFPVNDQNNHTDKHKPRWIDTAGHYLRCISRCMF